MKSASKGRVGRFALVCAAGISLCAPAISSEQRAAGPEKATSVGSPLQFRLVTTEQYLNTIGNVFGLDVRPQTKFAPMQRVDGLLQLGTLKAGVSETDVELYQSAAQTVVADVLSPNRRDFLIPCRPADASKPDEACARRTLNQFGPLLFRRALAPQELDRYVAVARQSSERLGDFYKGLGVALEALLVSPETLVVIEQAEADPKAPGERRLTSYSLASRLSYFLWNSAPDKALLDAAQKGELLTDAGRARAVDRMIASPRFEIGMRAFFDDMFALDDFNNLSKDAVIYSDFTTATAADAREQMLRTIIDQVVVRKNDYRDLYTTRETFMSPALAAIYEVPNPPAWTPHRFDETSSRVGIQTLVGFLAGHAHPGRSSPTLRGKALRELALCQHIPPPPPDVDFSAINNPSPHLRTQRDRVNEHLKNPACASCHRVMDPPGLALENFDGSGRFRATDNGAPMDLSGVLDGKAFKDPVEMGAALRNHPGVPTCLVKRMYAFAVGDTDQAAMRPALASLNERFATNGYKVPALAREIALSRSFYTVRTR